MLLAMTSGFLLRLLHWVVECTVRAPIIVIHFQRSLWHSLHCFIISYWYTPTNLESLISGYVRISLHTFIKSISALTLFYTATLQLSLNSFSFRLSLALLYSLSNAYMLRSNDSTSRSNFRSMWIWISMPESLHRQSDDNSIGQSLTTFVRRAYFSLVAARGLSKFANLS